MVGKQSVLNHRRSAREPANANPPISTVAPAQLLAGEPKRSLPDNFNTRSNQREIQWPAFHESDSFGTHTSYVITPSSAKTLLINPSSLVLRLYSNCPTWNFATLKWIDAFPRILSTIPAIVSSRSFLSRVLSTIPSQYDSVQSDAVQYRTFSG